MPYTLLPDDFVEDARTVYAGRQLGPASGIGRAVAVLVEAFSYSNRNLTDGVIEPVIAKHFKTDRRPLDVMTALAFPLPSGESGWVGGDAVSGWRILDWSRQLTRAEVLVRREKDRLRKKGKGDAPDVAAPLSLTLEEVAASALAELAPTQRQIVLRGNRLDLLEQIKGMAAKAQLPYNTSTVSRALDQVVRGGRYGS